MLQTARQALATLRTASPTLEPAAAACQRLYHKNVRILFACKSLLCSAMPAQIERAVD